MNLGIILILIVAFAYLSNSLNWRYLNYRITHLLYYIGVFIHEASHASLCVVTGAKIEKFEVFSGEPKVIYRKARSPFLSDLLISLAPLAGGLLFLFVINRYLLGDYFNLAADSNWRDVLLEPLRMIPQLNLLQWQSWVMILLFINIGAMIGPSLQDLKNIWPFLILLFFVDYAPLINFGLTVLSLIFINIAIQITAILSLFLFGMLRRVLTAR